MSIDTNDRLSTFEETYPKAEFSELIHLTLVIADAVLRLQAWMKLHSGRPPTSDPTQAA